MGRIKSLMVKKAAKQLIQSEHQFNASFEHNKKLLRSLMPSKSIQNKVAGYIARLMRMQQQPRVIKVAPVESSSFNQ